MGKGVDTEMKVSVVVPSRGDPKTLKRCISSILDQAHNSYEVLVIDGSKHAPGKKSSMKNLWKDPRVRYIHEEFFSMSGLRNRGIMESRSEIIMMTGADCEVPRDWISRMTGPIMAGEDIVQGGSTISSGGFWSRALKGPAEDRNTESSRRRYTCHVDTGNLAIRKKTLIDVGMFDRHLRNMEDVDLGIRFGRYGFGILYLDGVDVVRHCDNRLKGLFLAGVEKGKWLNFVYSMNKRGVDKKGDSMFKTLTLSNFLLFFPSTVAVLFRRGPSAFIHEFVEGTGWCIGILVGEFGKRRFLDSIRANYY